MKNKIAGLTCCILVFICVMPVIQSTATGESFEKKDFHRAWLYVGGNGTGNYTTIQSAINSANPGDTVFVFSGTYYEHVIVNKTINLIGENRDTTVIDGGLIGVVIYVSSDGVTISGFTVQNGDNGIHLSFSSNNSIMGNNAHSNNFQGIILSSSSNNTITGNNAADNVYGIYLDSSSNNRIMGNNVSNNDEGISLFSFSNNNMVAGNNAHSNNYQGIVLFSFSNNNTVTGNNVHSNNFQGIILVSSSNNTIMGNNASNNINGIHLFSSNNNSIMGNNAVNNEEGIHLSSSGNNTVIGNNAASNGDGIQLYFSNNNTIMGNNVSNNGEGIRLFFTNNNNIIISNNASNNVYGIRLGPPTDNNHLYHNNLISNTQNAIDSGKNIWDNGYPSGGNYWSDYTGNDTDGDGIGDISYNIPEGSNKDHYPFMEPNGWMNEPPDLTIGVRGFLGINLLITNNGQTDANNISWLIHVQGRRIFGQINKTENGTISILAGETKTIRTRILFFFGPLTIMVKVANEEQTMQGFKMGLLFLLKT